MRLVISNISNSVNDDEQKGYLICETEAEELEYCNKIEAEVQKWNYHTPGAVSMRYVSFQSWANEQINNLTMDQLSMLTVLDFLKLTAYFK